MLTSAAYLLPSVPTMLIDEQRGHYTEMIEALMLTGERLLAEEPGAIVAVSARWRSSGPFQADESPRHRSVIDLPQSGRGDWHHLLLALRAWRGADQRLRLQSPP